ncbi:hypothetical protein HID58_038009 [Brassica napus]|uniref:Uncharacterized protein n=1 Tax=Brassica napus TaxID=3708 RepID=A0ABQ8BN21_BRANA|nr:hypothetical protein HID58_038009 [Brassica napus]
MAPETSRDDGVDMLLLDSKATLMLATVNVNRLATYRTYLKEGSMYSITGFDIQCSNFWLSYSSLLIRFSDATSLDEITKPASPIPEECFRLVSSDTGHASAAPLLRGYAKGDATFLAPTVPGSFNALSQPLHVFTATILKLLVSFGIYLVEMAIADDTAVEVMTKLHNMRVYEDDIPGAISVPAKAEPNT